MRRCRRGMRAARKNRLRKAALRDKAVARRGKTAGFPPYGKRRPFCFARDPQNRRQTTTYRLYPFHRQAMRSLAVGHRAGCPCLPYARTCQFRPVAGFLFARLENAGSLQRRQGDELAPLHDGRRDKVFVEGVDMFPFRAHVADGGDAEAGAEAGFGRAVVMLALDGHAEELPGVLDEPEELVARFAALEGIEAQPAADGGRRSGDHGAGNGVTDARDDLLPVLKRPVGQMDAGFGPRGHGVGGSPAADQARVDGEPTLQIQKSVDRQRLVRDFKDGRSPVRITAPRVGRLALYFQEHMA